jgi:hypothetical protein
MGKYTDRVMSKMPHEMKEARFGHELNRIFRAKRIKEKYKMGYRSTVAYTIRFTADESGENVLNDNEAMEQCKASFYTFLAEAKVKCSGAFNPDFGVEVDEANFALNFLAEGVKWYEDYEDVKAHTALMDLSKEWAEESDVPFKGGNKNIGGIFMRVGEEMDDLTEDYWGEHDWEWMTMSRQIIVDWM